MTKRYKSKIDLAFVIPMAFLLLATEAFMVMNGSGAGAVITGFIILFIAYLFADTSYALTQDHKLKIKSGFLINKEIDVHTIEKIEPTRNPIASPALSLDRLKVTFDKHAFVIISPKDKSEFIKDLKTINPNILVG